MQNINIVSIQVQRERETHVQNYTEKERATKFRHTLSEESFLELKDFESSVKH